MKRCLRTLLLAFVCVVSCIVAKGTVFAATDTTAPVVKSATFQTTSVKKGENIQIDLDVVETETGVTDVQVGLYCYKGLNTSPLLLWGYAEFEGEGSGTISVEIPVATSDAAGEYYLGYISIEDNNGNSHKYFDHYNTKGYYVEGGKSYLQCYGKTDVANACLITNGARATVQSNGDDTAPIVTNAEFVDTNVEKTESIVVKLTVVEESEVASVDLIYEGYKGEQDIMIGRSPLEWSQDGDVITASMALEDNDTAGVYYLSQIRIKDSEGNERDYSCDIHVGRTYLTDEDGAYLVDVANANYKCYVKDNATVTVASNGDDMAPIVKIIKLQKETIAKPGVLPIDLTFAAADEIKEVTVVVRRWGATEQEIYNFTKAFATKEKKSDYTVKFPISTTMNTDKYYIERLTVRDFSGNWREYTAYGLENPYLVENGTTYMVDGDDGSVKAAFVGKSEFNVEDEFEVAFDSSLAAKDLISKIEAMEEGKTARIFIPKKGNNIATKEMFEAIKGKDKTLVFVQDNYQWVFNGSTVTKPKDIVLKISFEMVEGEEYQTADRLLKIDFAANGELPGPASVRVKSDYTFELFEMTEAMYLYYLNPKTEKLDYEKESNIEYILDGSDHWCQFNITHNSTYVVSGNKIVKIKKMSISSLSKKLAAGKKMKLTVTTKPANASFKKFKWNSSNKKYATVNSKGVVTAKKAGAGKKVKITATAKDGSKKKATITFTIMKDSVKSIKLKAAKKSVKAGGSVQVKATVKTTGKKANKKLKWTTSNKKYATVNSSGKVTTKKAGKGKTVKITAQSTDGSNKKATVTIKIK